MHKAMNIMIGPGPAHPVSDPCQAPSVNGVGFGHFSGELIPKNVRIGKKRTSIRLEPEMWAALDLIIKKEKIIPAHLFDQIAQAKKKNAAFTAALRSWILSYFVKRSGLGF